MKLITQTVQNLQEIELGSKFFLFREAIDQTQHTPYFEGLYPMVDADRRVILFDDLVLVASMWKRISDDTTYADRQALARLNMVGDVLVGVLSPREWHRMHAARPGIWVTCHSAEHFDELCEVLIATRVRLLREEAARFLAVDDG